MMLYITLSIASQRKERTEKAKDRGNGEQPQTNGCSKNRRDDSQDVYKERTTIDQMIPRAAGVRDYENHWNHRKVPLKKGTKINKNRKQEGSEGMLLIKGLCHRTIYIRKAKRRHHEQQASRPQRQVTF